MGSKPEWYDLLRAARLLNVPPWELVKQPMFWADWALTMNDAEIMARNNRAESEERRRSVGQ